MRKTAMMKTPVESREMLRAENLSVMIDGVQILRDLHFRVSEGEWLMIVGPNGAGKSTLLNAMTGGVPCSGQILFEGEDLLSMKSTERARRIAVLTQQHSVQYPFTVEEVVKLGRYAHGKDAAQDEAAVEHALRITGLEEKMHRSVLSLSGGELQRTFLAQAFCQQPKLFLLDEPANHLDLAYQKQIFSLISEWLKAEGRAVISIVHDLSLAKMYGTHALLLDGGEQIAFGESREVLTDENLNAVYGLEIRDWMQRLLKEWE